MPKANFGQQNKKDDEEVDLDAPVAPVEPDDISDEDEDPMEDDWIPGDEDEKDML